MAKMKFSCGVQYDRIGGWAVILNYTRIYGVWSNTKQLLTPKWLRFIPCQFKLQKSFKIRRRVTGTEQLLQPPPAQTTLPYLSMLRG